MKNGVTKEKMYQNDTNRYLKMKWAMRKVLPRKNSLTDARPRYTG